MLLFVGLGNPGREYEKTRHNMGFLTLDYFSEHNLKEPIIKSSFQGLFLKTNYLNEQVLFLKPQTYMNLSGISVNEIVKFYKIKLEDIVVIYDDMDLEPGKIRLRPSGSSGGHKGIKSIIENLGSENIKRIRIGIGKAPYSVIDYVLEKPTSDEQKEIDEAIKNACGAIDDIILKGFDHAMCFFNKK